MSVDLKLYQLIFLLNDYVFILTVNYNYKDLGFKVVLIMYNFYRQVLLFWYL